MAGVMVRRRQRTQPRRLVALHSKQRKTSGETADTPGRAEQCRNCGRPLTLEMGQREDVRMRRGGRGGRKEREQVKAMARRRKKDEAGVWGTSNARQRERGETSAGWLAEEGSRKKQL